MGKLLVLALVILAGCSGAIYQKFEEVFKGKTIDFEENEELHFGPGPEKRVEFGEKSEE